MKFGKWTCYESFNEMFVIMRCFTPMPSFGRIFGKGTRGLWNPAEARGAYGTRQRQAGPTNTQQRHAGPTEPGRGIKSLVLMIVMFFFNERNEKWDFGLFIMFCRNSTCGLGFELVWITWAILVKQKWKLWWCWVLGNENVLRYIRYFGNLGYLDTILGTYDTCEWFWQT